MLEGPSFLVSRELPSSCEEESKWIYNAFRVIELFDGNRHFEDRDEIISRKLLKHLDIPIEEDILFVLHDLLLSQADRSGSQHHKRDQSDSGSLIHQIGRDLSINCLLQCTRSDYGSIASLNQSFRSLICSGELYRLRRQVGIVEQWVYYSCNLFAWEAFDPVRCRWMRLPTVEANPCFMCSDKESLGVGTELLVFGRDIFSHLVYKYSLLTNSWSFGATTNIPRCLFGSASLGAIAIIAGGCDARGRCLSSAELYDSETGTWVILPSMHKPRKMCSGVFMDGKFYVIGGIGDGNSNELTCGEEFDLEMRTWREIPNMFPAQNRGAGTSSPATAKAPPLLAVVKNELYAANYEEEEVRKYDKGRNLWNTIGQLPESTTSMNGWGLAFRACGDQLLVIGGRLAESGSVVEINSWVPNEGQLQWDLLGRKHSGSFVYNCAVMGC